MIIGLAQVGQYAVKVSTAPEEHGDIARYQYSAISVCIRIQGCNNENLNRVWCPRNTLGLVFCSSLLLALAGCGVDSPSSSTTNTPPTQSDPPQSDPPQSDPPQSDAPTTKGYKVELSATQSISAYELKLDFSVAPNEGSMSMSNSFIVSDGTLVALGPVSAQEGKSLHFGALTYGNSSGFTGSAEVLT
ncbi:hypothetical protein AC626_14775, partial [Pseudoalteromonas rubra]